MRAPGDWQWRDVKPGSTLTVAEWRFDWRVCGYHAVRHDQVEIGADALISFGKILQGKYMQRSTLIAAPDLGACFMLPGGTGAANLN